MATEVDIPYVGQGQPLTATLGRDSWKAQWVEEEGRQSSTPDPPSILNIPIALLACLLCPILGPLAVIFAIEAGVMYKQGHYLESEALSERARGTSCYAIGIGVGLGLGLGILLGLGDRFGWY